MLWNKADEVRKRSDHLIEVGAHGLRRFGNDGGLIGGDDHLDSDYDIREPYGVLSEDRLVEIDMGTCSTSFFVGIVFVEGDAISFMLVICGEAELAHSGDDLDAGRWVARQIARISSLESLSNFSIKRRAKPSVMLNHHIKSWNAIECSRRSVSIA